MPHINTPTCTTRSTNEKTKKKQKHSLLFPVSLFQGGYTYKSSKFGYKHKILISLLTASAVQF
jgi:hypothetical protein